MDVLRDGAERPLVVGGGGVAAAVVVGTAITIDRWTFDALSGILTLLVLSLGTVALLRSIGRSDDDPVLVRIFQWGFAAKVVGALVRHFVNTVVYDGNGDFGVYKRGAAELATLFRAGELTAVAPGLESYPPESQRVALVLGVVFLVTGASTLAGIFVFTTICYWGQVLMCRALRRAVPEADHRHYTALVMFLPSLLYWPSSIGKDALMIGVIGLATYGGAVLLSPRPRLSGLVVFLVGVAGLGMIRPHLSLIAVSALALASGVGAVSRARAAGVRTSAVRLVAVVVLLGAAVAATTQVSQVLGDGAADERSLTDVLERTADQTSIGGSSFEPAQVSSIVDLPAAALTVLFRPFPWEASSATALLSAVEGLVLLGIVVAGWRRLRAWPRAARHAPYLVYATAFTVVFVVAFSYVGNFGILARQRTQMLPFFLVLLCMPPVARRARTFAVRRPTMAPLAPTGRPEAGWQVPVGVASAGSVQPPIGPGPIAPRPVAPRPIAPGAVIVPRGLPPRPTPVIHEP